MSWAEHSVQGGGLIYPQAVDTFKWVSTLFGLPLALAPALSARGIRSVGGCVWTLCIGPTLNTDSIILQGQKYSLYTHASVFDGYF